MGEIIKFPEREQNDLESGLQKLGETLAFAGKTPHDHNKRDLLSSFNEQASELMEKHNISSENELILALEERGFENASGTLNLLREVFPE